MRFILKYNLHVLILYILLAFPLFYFVYKFGVLLGGYEDAKSYLKLFDDLNSKEVPSPFNLRLLNSAIINLIHRSGLFYSTECAIDAFPSVDKTYFFSNILNNFICITLTSFSLFIVFIKLQFSRALSFLAGVLYLLGFGTIFYMMMPGVDSLSVLIFTWALYFYMKRKYAIIPLLLLLIFQREYYFLAFMLITLMDFFKNGRVKYYAHIFIVNAICWTIYFLLRKYVFFTHHWHYQTSGTNLMRALLEVNVDLVTMIRQSLMTMNIYFIYWLILIYKKTYGYKINSYYLYVVLLLILQITLLSIATTSGNNNGRYLYFSTPLLLYLILLEISPLIKIELKKSEVESIDSVGDKTH